MVGEDGCYQFLDNHILLFSLVYRIQAVDAINLSKFRTKISINPLRPGHFFNRNGL